MRTGEFYDKLRTAVYRRQWISHLKEGKLYRQVDGGYFFFWEDQVPAPVMFVSFSPDGCASFLDGDKIQTFKMIMNRKPQYYWERVL